MNDQDFQDEQDANPPTPYPSGEGICFFAASRIGRNPVHPLILKILIQTIRRNYRFKKKFAIFSSSKE
jgi:hypothetical protein